MYPLAFHMICFLDYEEKKNSALNFQRRYFKNQNIGTGTSNIGVGIIVRRLQTKGEND